MSEITSSVHFCTKRSVNFFPQYQTPIIHNCDFRVNIMIIKLQLRVLKLEHQVIVLTINQPLTSRHLVQMFTSVTHQLITLKVAGINV